MQRPYSRRNARLKPLPQSKKLDALFDGQPVPDLSCLRRASVVKRRPSLSGFTTPLWNRIQQWQMDHRDAVKPRNAERYRISTKESHVGVDMRRTAFLGRLSLEATEAQIRAAVFPSLPLEVTIARDKKSGLSRGYALLSFANQIERDRCVMVRRPPVTIRKRVGRRGRHHRFRGCRSVLIDGRRSVLDMPWAGGRTMKPRWVRRLSKEEKLGKEFWDERRRRVRVQRRRENASKSRHIMHQRNDKDDMRGNRRRRYRFGIEGEHAK